VNEHIRFPRPQVRLTPARAGTPVDLIRSAIADLLACQRDMRTPSMLGQLGSIPPVLTTLHLRDAQRHLNQLLPAVPATSRAHDEAEHALSGVRRLEMMLCGIGASDMPSAAPRQRPAVDLLDYALAHARSCLSELRNAEGRKVVPTQRHANLPVFAHH
jgi:hypothetical protein